MKAKEIMTSEVVSVDRETPIKEAAVKMAETDVGSVIVNDNDSLIGIITDRDITIRAVANNDDLKNITCEDIMSSDVITANTNANMEEVIDLMSENQIKRIPIVENNQVVGIISLRDISQSYEWDDEAGEVLNDITD